VHAASYAAGKTRSLRLHLPCIYRRARENRLRPRPRKSRRRERWARNVLPGGNIFDFCGAVNDESVFNNVVVASEIKETVRYKWTKKQTNIVQAAHCDSTPRQCGSSYVDTISAVIRWYSSPFVQISSTLTLSGSESVRRGPQPVSEVTGWCRIVGVELTTEVIFPFFSHVIRTCHSRQIISLYVI